MKLDIDHVLFWMDAIRNSNNSHRTLEAFWKGQVKSKLWLIDNLEPFVKLPSTLEIHGGWVGVLASLIFQSKLPVIKIVSLDLDPSCKDTAVLMNRVENLQDKFTAVTANMIDRVVDSDIIINTSCEHITQDDYDTWLSHIPEHTLILLQSNNYNIEEHVRIANSLEEFKQQSNISVKWQGQLELPLYTRYMLIGYKNVTGNS
jgi:hypothetical protein